MKANIKLGTVFGVELGLHYSWIVIALLIMFSLAGQFHQVNSGWSDTVVWSAAILTSMLFFAGLFAHELSHAMVARARGLPVHRITLFLLGGMAQLEQEPADAGTEFWMAIAGPIASGVIGVILLGLARASGWVPWTAAQTPGVAILVWLGYINLVLGAFNLVPGFPLDGGRVLRAVIWWVTGSAERSTRIAARIGQLIGAGFIAYGIVSFFGKGGFGGLWFALIGWFLLQAAGASILQVQVGSLLRGMRVSDVMSQDCPSVSGGMGLQEFVDEQLLKTGRRCFLVVEDHGAGNYGAQNQGAEGRVVGLITPHEVRSMERARWPFLTVHDAMRPVDEVHSLPPEAPATQALEMMGRQDVNQIPIVLGGQLQGIVTRAHLLQMIHSRSELLGRS